MRPNHFHDKCTPSRRQSHHIFPEKSPISSFRSSALAVVVATSRCEIAPLSAATGYLPAVTISSCASYSIPIDNTTYSYPMLFDPNLGPPGFNLPVTSPLFLHTATVHQPIAAVWTSPQGSLCTNSGVDSLTWTHFTCPIWPGMLGRSTSHLVCSGSSAPLLPFGPSS